MISPRSPIAALVTIVPTRRARVAGFTALASEWWHFDATDAMAYPLADEPLD